MWDEIPAQSLVKEAGGLCVIEMKTPPKTTHTSLHCGGAGPAFQRRQPQPRRQRTMVRELEAFFKAVLESSTVMVGGAFQTTEQLHLTSCRRPPEQATCGQACPLLGTWRWVCTWSHTTENVTLDESRSLSAPSVWLVVLLPRRATRHGVTKVRRLLGCVSLSPPPGPEAEGGALGCVAVWSPGEAGAAQRWGRDLEVVYLFTFSWWLFLKLTR